MNIEYENIRNIIAKKKKCYKFQFHEIITQICAIIIYFSQIKI